MYNLRILNPKLQIVEGGHKTGMVCDHLNCYANTWHVMLDESKVEDTLGMNVQCTCEGVVTKCGISYAENTEKESKDEILFFAFSCSA